MKLRTVIIDDESAGRSFLSKLIEEYIPQLDVIGTAESALEGVKLVQANKVDLIFLDVEMPNGSGFDFMDAIDHNNYHIVLTTAYKDFAIKAFKYHVYGYLLKPIDIDDLEEVVNSILSNLKPETETTKRIVFKTLESIEYIDPNQIIRVETEGNYATIYSLDMKKLIVSKNMKQIEEILNHPYFVKSHKSHLINVNHIKRFIKQDGGVFEMIDGSVAPVSRRKKDEILKELE